MSYIGKYASSFSIENDVTPHVEATLVIDVRQYITNESKPDKFKGGLGAWAVASPVAQKSLLPVAEAHLRANPDGHVAFGCRLGQDRSPALARELERRMLVNPPGAPPTHHEELVKAQAKQVKAGHVAGLLYFLGLPVPTVKYQCVTSHGPYLVCGADCHNAGKLADLD